METEKEIEKPPLTVDEALEQAIQNGQMTIKEAEECREAYYRAFHQGETS